MFNSGINFSSNNDFSYASTSIYLPAQQAGLCLGPHSLFGTGRQLYIFCTVLQLLFCHRPLWNRRHVPKPAPLPLSLVGHGPEGSHKGCHRQSNQGGEKQKQKKTKVPLTTFGVPASPCCFFMWLSRVRWDLKDLSHI